MPPPGSLIRLVDLLIVVDSFSIDAIDRNCLRSQVIGIETVVGVIEGSVDLSLML